MLRCLPFILLASCLSTCMVPIQIMRVTLTESFEQNFDFDGIPRDELTPILTTLLGDKWAPYSSDEVKAVWDSDSLVSNGIAVLNFSLVPDKKPKQFFITGVGSYDIFHSEDRKAYFSTKFYLANEEYYNIDDLETTSIISVKFMQVATNQFLLNSGTYALAPQKPIRVDVKVKKVPGKSIFSIDYTAAHQAYIGEQKIGTIKFRAPQSTFDKIIDLRGIRTLPRRYKDSWRFN